MKYHSIDIQLRFYEFDSYGIVNNMFCYSWFELGRFALSEHIGLSRQFLSTGYEFVVLSNQAQYLKSIKKGNKISCKTCIGNITGTKISFLHKVVDSVNGCVYINGSSTTVLISNGKLILKFPPTISDLINSYVGNEQGGFPK